MARQVGRVGARVGWVGLGKFWCGRWGEERRGLARIGMAGMAGKGTFRLVWLGTVWQVRRGLARRGMAWRGLAGQVILGG